MFGYTFSLSGGSQTRFDVAQSHLVPGAAFRRLWRGLGDGDPVAPRRGRRARRRWHLRFQCPAPPRARPLRCSSAAATEGIFVNPFERGEIGPNLFRAACRVGSSARIVSGLASVVVADTGSRSRTGGILRWSESCEVASNANWQARRLLHASNSSLVPCFASCFRLHTVGLTCVDNPRARIGW